jgi:hypothetical protein
MTLEAIRNELLTFGLDDMLGLWWVIGVVADHIGVNPNDDSRVMHPTLDAIHDLLVSNYAIAGNVETDNDGILFVKSWGMNANDTVERIKREWEKLAAPPNLGDVVWLELTDNGREQAQAISD